MLTAFTDKLRLLGHQALETTPISKDRPKLRQLRNLASIANELLGRPLCSADELAERRAPRASSAPVAAPAPAAPVQVPVMVYFDGKDHRTKAKVEELLRGRKIVFRLLDVTDDEAERSWVTTAAHTNEFPIVVIGGAPIGGLAELTQLDLQGDLQRRVFSPSS